MTDPKPSVADLAGQAADKAITADRLFAAGATAAAETYALVSIAYAQAALALAARPVTVHNHYSKDAP